MRPLRPLCPGVFELQMNGAIDIPKEDRTPISHLQQHLSHGFGMCELGQCARFVRGLSPKRRQGSRARLEMEKVRTTCPSVSRLPDVASCEGRQDPRISAVEEAQPNEGRLCVKGRFGYDFIYFGGETQDSTHQGKRFFPRGVLGRGPRPRCRQVQGIIAKHGPIPWRASVHPEVSTKIPTRCRNCSVRGLHQQYRQLRTYLTRPTVAGLAKSFGSGAMTNSFGEFSRAKMILAIGTNMTEAHPVAASFVKNATANGAQLIVVDPRRSGLADFATLHVPIRVGSDIAFLNGVMNVLITENLYDREYVETCCTGFEALRAKVWSIPPNAPLIAESGGTIREVRKTTGCRQPRQCWLTLWA